VGDAYYGINFFQKKENKKGPREMTTIMFMFKQYTGAVGAIAETMLQAQVYS